MMRLTAILLFYNKHPAEAIIRAADSSRTTHGARDAVDACRYYASLMVDALHGIKKDELLSEAYECEPNTWKQNPLSDKIIEIATGSYKLKDTSEIRGSGHVVRSLEAALWAFYNSTNYRDGVLMTVNFGDDTDTTAAIYGQLAGAYYGIDSIPHEWQKSSC